MYLPTIPLLGLLAASTAVATPLTLPQSAQLRSSTRDAPAPPPDTANQCTYTPTTANTPFQLAAYPPTSHLSSPLSATWLSAARVNVISPYPDAYLLHAAPSPAAASTFTYDALAHSLRTILPKGDSVWGYNAAPLRAPGDMLTFRAGDGNAPPASLLTVLQATGCARSELVLGDSGAHADAHVWRLCRNQVLSGDEVTLFYGGAESMREGCEAVRLELVQV